MLDRGSASGSPPSRGGTPFRHWWPGWVLLRTVAPVLVLLTLIPGGVRAQLLGDCEFPDFQDMQSFATDTGDRIYHFRSPTITCGDGVRINADSAVIHESIQYFQFFRNVVFREGETRLEAGQAYYFSDRGLLRAWSAPVLTQRDDGSVIRGDTMELVRGGGEQGEDRLTVWGRRPSATLFPSARESTPDTAPSAGDTLGRPTPQAPPGEPTPYEIEARRIFLEGEGLFLATGAVTVRRDSLNARADSMEYREGSGALLLEREAWVQTASTELAARSIRLDIPQDEIRAAVARGDAILEGEDLRILAPILDLRFSDGEMERLVAMRDPAMDSLTEEELLQRPPHPEAEALGLGRFPLRPHAVAEDFLLAADSMEIETPDQKLDELWAIGNARGESMARDSLNTRDTPSLIRRDWIEGDTIIATFLPAEEGAESGGEGPRRVLAVPDSGAVTPPPEIEPPEGIPGQEADSSRASYTLDRLTARGSAKSLYRLEASDSTLAAEGKLATHYVVGSEIVIYMEEGEVDHMEVKGQTQGIHLEPLPGGRSGTVPPDTAIAQPPPSGGGATGAVLITNPPGRGGRG